MQIKPFYDASIKDILKQVKLIKMKAMLNFKMAGVALLLSLFSMSIYAQPGGPGRGQQMTEEDIKERSQATAKTLGLNEKQQEKILAIDMDFYNKMQIERQKMRNMERTEETRNVMREKMTKMNDERNKQYKEVLTPEQYKKFIEIQEQRRDEMRQQRQQSNPDGEKGGSSERGRGRN
jgi:Spy/CpxP family protein refolding chaperone